MGGILWLQGRDEEAMDEVRKSIELDPELVFNNLRMGMWAAYDFGRLDEGIINFRKAYSLDPENSGPTMQIAGMYINLGASEEALAWVERLLELSPTSTWAWFAAHQAHTYFGDNNAPLEYAERALELAPRNEWALRAIGTRDIEEGHVDLALERWPRAYPVLATSDNQVVDDTSIRTALFFAQNLMAAGEAERARRLLHGCLDALRIWRRESFVRESYVHEFEPEIYASMGQTEETLEALRRAIVDGHYRSVPMWYDLPVYDFIRDEPEFQELMEILHADLSEQLERVREMECNGELAPAPSVVLEVACN